MKTAILKIRNVVVVATVCLTLVLPEVVVAQQGLGKLSTQQRTRRLDHAKELLGQLYKKSVVRSGERLQKINSNIYRWTAEALPAKYKSQSKKVAQTIIDEAHKYSLDPVFLIAVIQTESSFNPSMIGGVGEIGLMQIRPETADWIAKKMKLKKGDLRDPSANIRIGAAYLSYLRERFDEHARLYLAAYNMGPGNVRQLRKNDVWPTQYPSKVMGFYVNYYSELVNLQANQVAHAKPGRS